MPGRSDSGATRTVRYDSCFEYPREVVEQVGDVCGQIGIGGQQTEVLVETGGAGVVVARADVAVAVDVIAFVTDHEGELRVRLQTHHAVHDVDTRLLEHARPRDVRLLVEARGELDERHHLLPPLGGADERAHDRRVLARGPVQRLLDREHLRVAGGLLDEELHRRVERVVGVLDHHIALPNDREDVGPSGDGRLQPALRASRPWLVLQLRHGRARRAGRDRRARAATGPRRRRWRRRSAPPSAARASRAASTEPPPGGRSPGTARAGGGSTRSARGGPPPRRSRAPRPRRA